MSLDWLTRSNGKWLSLVGHRKHDRNRAGGGREPEKALFGGCKEKDGVMREEGSGCVQLVSSQAEFNLTCPAKEFS